MKYPWAKSRPISHNFEKDWRARFKLPLNGLVIHISDGTSLESVFNTFNSPPPESKPGEKKKFKASAHFGVEKDGDVWQFLDTDHRAHAVGGSDDTDGRWLSVENVAVAGDELTEEQIEECSWLFAWLSKEFGFNLALANSKGERGLGYHTMFKNTDHDCPGTRVIKQLPEILRRAIDYKGYLNDELSETSQTQ